MALQDPDHWLVVNGQGSPTDIAQEIRQGVADRLGL
jgi:hypothetical protein